MRRKRRIGGIEYVVPLVEDVPGRPVGLVAAEGRLDHHQRMVGDDDFRPAGAAHGPFDEAFGEMRAGGVDALTAPVGEPHGDGKAKEIRQPGRKIPADHVAVTGRADPSRQQTHADGGPGVGRQPADGFFEVQQAKVVLPAFPDHRAQRFLRRVRIDPVKLAIQLALQIPGIGADPDGPVVPVRPETGRRQIALRLADPGARLGEHRPGVGRFVDGVERAGDLTGEQDLLGTCLRPGAERRRQLCFGFIRAHRKMAGLRRRRVLGPFGQVPPGPEGIGRVCRAVFGIAVPAAERR